MLLQSQFLLLNLRQTFLSLCNFGLQTIATFDGCNHSILRLQQPLLFPGQILLGDFDTRLDGRNSGLELCSFQSFLQTCCCRVEGVEGLESTNPFPCYALVWDGKARSGTARTDGKALDEARKRKERTCPELAGEGGKTRLVVLGAEVGGRWSQETVDFLSSLAWAKVRDGGASERRSPSLFQTVVRALRLCSGEGFRHVPLGRQPVRCRWSDPVSARGHP